MRTNKLAAILIASSALFFSCSEKMQNNQDNMPENPQGSEGISVEFGYNLSDVLVKSTITTADDVTFTAAWTEGDAVTMYYNVSGQAGVSEGTYSNEKLTITNIPNTLGDWSYRCVYPKETEGKIAFGNRTQAGNAFNGAYDLMAANVSEIAGVYPGKTAEDGIVSFEMQRKTAVVYFHLTGGPANDKVTKAVYTVEGDDIAAEYVTIGEDLALSAENGTKTIETTFSSDAPSMNDCVLWFSVLPGTITKQTLTVTTESGKEYEIVAAGEVTRQAGYLYKAVKNMEYKLTTLTAGSANYQQGPVAAKDAVFVYPMGLAFDEDNNVYIAEQLTHTIKIMSPGANSSVSVFAGQYTDSKGWDQSENYADGALTEAKFSHPMDVAYTGNGTLFVADRYNNAVRKIKDGQVTTFGNRRFNDDYWGNDTEGPVVHAKPTDAPFYGTYSLDKWVFTRPLALYYDNTRDYLYVASEMHYIVKVNLKTNIVDLVAGSWGSGSQIGNCRDAQLACLNFPAAMTMDAEGNLYVANQYGHFISKVDQDCNITIFAGTPGIAGNANGAKESATFNEPDGLEFDDEGNLLVADFKNHCIRKIDMATGEVSNWCGAQDKATSTDGTLSQATMSFPTCVRRSPSNGKLYMTQAEGYAAVRIFGF